MLRTLNSTDTDFAQALDRLLQREAEVNPQAQVQQQVAEIIAQVRQQGDRALIDMTARFDHCDVQALGMRISDAALDAALAAITPKQRTALEYAAERIRSYHQRQLQESWHYEEQDGTRLGQKITPLQRVGLYVPGGKASYPSSVLMNAIPARVAGVQELIMVTPTPHGEVNQLVLAAARIAGVDQVFRVGGAQAVAALAYGTETIPAVDKITGPGNAWVAAAKQQVFGQVGIDMIAGPSEVLVVADGEANPDWVAMDLFAQAEHDEQAQAILLTRDANYAERVQESIARLLPQMQRQEIITQALQANGAVIVVDSTAELVRVADTIAAEHLEIFTADAEQLAAQISHAGAIFIGQYSAEALGDYCAGPNHVLPTSGTARFSSPLGVYDFQKRTSIIQASPAGAHKMAEMAAEIAQGESLQAHAKAAAYRLKS